MSKTVASLQKGGGKHTPCASKCTRPKTGAYAFRQEVVHNDEVKAWFAN